MLNFLCVDVDVLIEDISSLIGVIIAIIIAVIVIVNKAKVSNLAENATTSDDDDNTYPFGNHPNATGQLTPEQRRYQSTLKQRQSSQKPTTMQPQGADGHTHVGTVETYDSTVGSLGSVSDEGCSELDGVRLIVTDLTYETDDHQKAYNLNAIRKSLILGEVLNNPRFKHPYGRK